MDKPIIPNLLLIAGTGRNTGKTTLASSIIRTISRQFPCVGIKISPHFHAVPDEKDILARGDDFIISSESNVTGRKDSSLMLQAGASKVYFVQTTPFGLAAVWEFILKITTARTPIVCESGGLSGIVKPGLFLFCHAQPDLYEGPKESDYQAIADCLVNGKLSGITGKVRFDGTGWILD